MTLERTHNHSEIIRRLETSANVIGHIDTLGEISTPTGSYPIKQIARETMEIYAPLTDRMGMNRIRDELEDISFKIWNKQETIDLMD